jgi:hypothetical protein
LQQSTALSTANQYDRTGHFHQSINTHSVKNLAIFC